MGTVNGRRLSANVLGFLLLGTITLLMWPDPAVSTDGKLELAVEIQQEALVGEVVVANVRLTNRSSSHLTVRKPTVHSGALLGEITGPGVKSSTANGDYGLEPQPYVELEPGATTTALFPLPQLAKYSSTGEMETRPGTYSIAFRYGSVSGSPTQKRMDRKRVEWKGMLAVRRSIVLRRTSVGEESDLARAVRRQDSSINIATRSESFERRTQALELLSTKYSNSRLIALAFRSWEAEGRFLERYDTVGSVANRLRGFSDPHLTASARESLAWLAALQADWPRLTLLLREVDEPVRALLSRHLSEKKRPRAHTLTSRLKRIAEEESRFAVAQRQYEARGRNAGDLRSRTIRRLRELQSAVAGLPAAPGEDRLRMSETEITARVEQAVRSGQVADGHRFSVGTPLDDRETYRARLEIGEFEKVLRARKTHAQHRREWLTERPKDPLLLARQEATEVERSLQPLSPEERKRINEEWQRVSADGVVTVEEYRRMGALLEAMGQARERR